jgi:hypothetical protein
MWRRILFVCLFVAMPVLGQEGHPLTGTWTGDWGAASAARSHITLVIGWEGDDKIAGVINPGPDAVPIQNIVINFTNWTVRIEAESKDAAGKALRIQADGKIENLGSPRRKLSGTWRQGTVMGDFNVTRQQ